MSRQLFSVDYSLTLGTYIFRFFANVYTYDERLITDVTCTLVMRKDKGTILGVCLLQLSITVIVNVIILPYMLPISRYLIPCCLSYIRDMRFGICVSKNS